MGKISVIIPLYNGRNTLKQTLHSIAMQSIISETEIVIVNDCDGVNYEDILAKFDNLNIVYVQRRNNGGCGQARNTGIRNASADYVCFIDADDQFVHPFALEIVYNKISNNCICCNSTQQPMSVRLTFVSTINIDTFYCFSVSIKCSSKFSNGSPCNIIQINVNSVTTLIRITEKPESALNNFTV